jgi:hypothetical protein
MGTWAFVRPEATVNLISNPSAETVTTGYTAAAGAALARSTTQQAKGLYSLRVTPTANVGDGVYFAVTLVATTTYTFSVSVFGVDTIPYRIYIYDATAPVILGTPVTFTGSGAWTRQVVTATTGANTSCRVYVVKNNDASTGAFYVDALQLEAKAYATTYCDGDQDGCVWAAGEHVSTSSRDGQSAAGGRMLDLDGDDYGFDVRAAIGVGMPPVELIDTLPAQSDGADHQRSIVRPRPFQLVGVISGDDRDEYHTHRLNLVEAFNPHRISSDQAVRLRYTHNNVSVQIAARYEGGLEKQPQPGKSLEEIGLRFKAQEDPFWYTVMGVANGSGGGGAGGGQGSIDGTVQQNVTNANYILQRDADGLWSALGTGMNGTVFALAAGPDGTLYAGGLFTTAGGGGANRIASWNGSAWSALGSGLDAQASALAIGADGTLYVGGIFTTAGGGGANRIASWNGSAWSALGSGLNGIANAVVMGPDGTLYAGGLFTTAGGGGANRIASWNGSAWSALGSGLDNDVDALAMGPDGTLYAGGAFTTAGGGGANRIASWNGSAWSALGSGLDGTVFSLIVGPDGTLYAGGAFTTAGGSAANKIAAWNGSTWSALGSGLNNSVYSLAQHPARNVINVGGVFTTAGGITLPDGLAKWVGGSWATMDIDLPGTPTVYAELMQGDSTFTIGFSTTGTAVAAGIN